MTQLNPVERALEQDEAAVTARSAMPAGPIATMVAAYHTQSPNLLGFVLDMGYDQATIVTCDAWKRRCGGLPRNAFVVVRLNPRLLALPAEDAPAPSLLLARILQAAPTPLSSELQQTIFALHKVQAPLDPYTNAELQWGAVRAAILGTYYDDGDRIEFGSDIDSYISPHFYEVYVPTSADLETLVNSFVSRDKPIAIGHLRYTETLTTKSKDSVPIKVSPHDFVANRTALFGKTTMGKSNIIKVIADMMMRSEENVGQIIFDISGEYSTFDDHHNVSILDLHRDKCICYNLFSHAGQEGREIPQRLLKVNFYEQVELGHSIIVSLYDKEHGSRPNYLLPLLDWRPVDEGQETERFPEEGDRRRYLRARSMYFAALAKAGFRASPTQQVRLILNQDIRRKLAEDPAIRAAARLTAAAGGEPEIDDRQPLRAAIVIYERLHRLYEASLRPREDDAGEGDGAPSPGAPGSGAAGPVPPRAASTVAPRRGASRKGDLKKLFPPSPRTGDPYFDPIHVTLLKMIGDTSVSGTQYLIPFTKYHDPAGGNIVRDIVAHIDGGQTVIVDLSNADETVARHYTELISKEIFWSQSAKFGEGRLGDHSVLFYFEEAHNLFKKDDSDLRSIYNRIAKEGAKYRIGMVYATQSMTTLSPDLLKNTENFFIAHLNDDREINELTKKYEFRDMGLDVQRCKRRGYVRMITLSHRYALPVQVKKFGQE